ARIVRRLRFLFWRPLIVARRITTSALLVAIASAAFPISQAADIEFRDGSVVYQADQQGNRMPDFSYAWYRASEVPIPTVLAKVVVGDPVEDNTRVIQDAIDQVSRLEANPDGFRGAVLIPPGPYLISGSLRLNVSGVVLRGSGAGQQGTTLIATGADRRAL